MAYKAQFPGKLTQHNEAQGSGDRVNAAVVWQQFTFLSGEICQSWRFWEIYVLVFGEKTGWGDR
jgi:hypothetical protein